MFAVIGRLVGATEVAQVRGDVLVALSGGAKKPVESLDELPARVWKLAPNEGQGTQFFTRVKVGQGMYPLMLDGGSGVNSVPEEVVCMVLTDMRQQNIPLGDPVIRSSSLRSGRVPKN